MSKRWLALGMAMIMGVSVLATTVTFGADEGNSVDVMFVHDVHSHLNEFATVENGEYVVLGGISKIKKLID